MAESEGSAICLIEGCLPFGKQPCSLAWLGKNLRDHTGPDGLAAFADGEAETLFHRDGRMQLHDDLDIVTRHDHLAPFLQADGSCHISGP